jgi:hypothetical protein
MSKLAFMANAGSDIPEQIGLTFGTTGPQGGNHSHGGEATLELRIESGYHAVEIDVDDKTRFRVDAGDWDNGMIVRITGCGDWELEGFVDALIDLGKQLSEHRTRLKWNKWMEEENDQRT